MDFGTLVQWVLAAAGVIGSILGMGWLVNTVKALVSLNSQLSNKQAELNRTLMSLDQSFRMQIDDLKTQLAAEQRKNERLANDLDALRHDHSTLRTIYEAAQQHITSLALENSQLKTRIADLEAQVQANEQAAATSRRKIGTNELVISGPIEVNVHAGDTGPTEGETTEPGR